jgi:hypothetical protein
VVCREGGGIDKTVGGWIMTPYNPEALSILYAIGKRRRKEHKSGRENVRKESM